MSMIIEQYSFEWEGHLSTFKERPAFTPPSTEPKIMNVFGSGHPPGGRFELTTFGL
jgi:hypothetical protein